jgi:minimal PKS acyl carrier protein
MTEPMTIDQLRDIMVACAGGGDTEALSGDISAFTFQDLGYDSLALLETSTRLKLDHGVIISDDEILELRTPKELLDLINEELTA